MPDPLSPTPQKILVVPLRYIGDTVLTVPLLRNLRRHYPQARIDLLASPVTEGLMALCPYVDQVRVEPRGSLKRLQLLKEGGYDTVFLLRKSVSLALMCKLAGVRQVIGYDKQRFPFGYKRWGWFLDRWARYPSLNTDTPQAVSHLGLLAAAGIPVVDDHLELWTTAEDEARLHQLLASHGIQPPPQGKPIAILHAASASHGKQIEVDRFSQSVQRLVAAGYQVLATGTASDAALYQPLGLPITNLAGQTSLRETVALYRQAELLLTVDSGPIHLGAAAGVPRIAGVFGPTNERQWGPHNAHARFAPVFMDLPCRPCYAKVCSHNNCRVQLGSLQIAEAVSSLLQEESPETQSGP